MLDSDSTAISGNYSLRPAWGCCMTRVEVCRRCVTSGSSEWVQGPHREVLQGFCNPPSKHHASSLQLKQTCSRLLQQSLCKFNIEKHSTIHYIFYSTLPSSINILGSSCCWPKLASDTMMCTGIPFWFHAAKSYTSYGDASSLFPSWQVQQRLERGDRSHAI